MKPENFNIVSAFIGALVAILLKVLFDRISTSIKLNRLRKIVLEYSISIGLDKSSQYIKDMNHISGYIMAYSDDEIKKYAEMNYGVDAMPMFTSDIFRSFSQDELRRISYNSLNYIILLDISYSIDFLKEYLALELYDKYYIKVRKHFEDDGISVKDEAKHFEECGYLKSLAESAVNEIKMKIKRAEETHHQIHVIIGALSGYDLIWTLKYFIKQ